MIANLWGASKTSDKSLLDNGRFPPLFYKPKGAHLIQTNMPRTCVSCQQRLYGRSDQRFCSDYCRNRYHNQRKQADNAILRQVNKILRKNRSILQQHWKSYRLSSPLPYLQLQGFQEQYFTSTQQTAEGDLLFICYDMGYCIREEAGEALVEICELS